MLFLPRSRNILPTGNWSWPFSPGGKPSVLSDGYAYKKVSYGFDVFDFQPLFTWGEQATLMAIAGYEVNRPLTQARVRARVGTSTWQSYHPLTFDGKTAYAQLPPPAASYTAYHFSLSTGVSGTVHQFGEILIGVPFESPEPFSLTVSVSHPTITNGDFSVTVGNPLQRLEMQFRPQDSSAIYDLIREVGAESGLLVVGGKPYFGRFLPQVSYTRTTEHDFFEGISLTFQEMEAGSIWQ